MKNRNEIQKRYLLKKKQQGWKHICIFVPEAVKDKLLNYKNSIMEEYWKNQDEELHRSCPEYRL